MVPPSGRNRREADFDGARASNVVDARCSVNSLWPRDRQRESLPPLSGRAAPPLADSRLSTIHGVVGAGFEALQRCESISSPEIALPKPTLRVRFPFGTPLSPSTPTPRL